MQAELAEVVERFSQRLHLPDKTPLLAVLGSVAANVLPGDPVWLMIVWPPSAGKSELLAPLNRLSYVHSASTFTAAALLSGTPGKERATDSRGGLLREIGDFGIVVLKDFGSVLSMHREARAETLAACREIYDGAWTRHVGSEGGRALHWKGKVGLVAGVTPVIDKHHSVMASLGERFLLLRPAGLDRLQQAQAALRHRGQERGKMRTELADSVAGLFDELPGCHDSEVSLSEGEETHLVTLANFVSVCRSAVERDSTSRDIDLIPEAEAPARLAVTLAQLYTGLRAIGLDEDEAWPIIRKVGLDCIPALRLRTIRALDAAGTISTGELASRVGYPTSTARRILEDLEAHKTVARSPGGQGRADLWTLQAWASHALHNLAVPETSEAAPRSVPETSEHPTLFSSQTRNDISGTVPAELREAHS